MKLFRLFQPDREPEPASLPKDSEPTPPAPDRPAWKSSPFYRFHEITKHSYASLYSNQWFLDWDNQPDPFRRWEGAPVVELPHPERPEAADYFHLPAPAGDPPPWTLQRLSQLLFYSMALSAWKVIPGTEHRWSLRVNPSSGNLHPTETHLVARGVEGLPDGVYHFRVDNFTLEARGQGPVDGVLREFGLPGNTPFGAVTLVLTSLFWRESWKYRARAFRYCHHDLGHATGALVEALRGLGYGCRFRHQFEDDAVVAALGLEGSDEKPGLILTTTPALPLEEGSSTGTGAPLATTGTPNVLSAEEYRFRPLEEVYEATRNTSSKTSPLRPADKPKWETTLELPREYRSEHDFWEVVRRRRSAVDMDGRTGIDRQQFGAILERATRGGLGSGAWLPESDIGSERPAGDGGYLIHLYVYVHRVEGIEPGCYYYDREQHALAPVKLGDVKQEAYSFSLMQAIASEGAFCVSLLADLDRAYAAWGDRGYRAAHMEAGFIGQGLYLGAEAAGTNATGIGAFFDDDVNRFLAAREGREVIYHFTVGRGVEDTRIEQRKGYAWEGG